MREAILIGQSVCAVILVVFILIQVRGTGFGRSTNSSSFTRRGAERFVFRATFVVAVIFLVLSVLNLVI